MFFLMTKNMYFGNIEQTAINFLSEWNELELPTVLKLTLLRRAVI